MNDNLIKHPNDGTPLEKEFSPTSLMQFKCPRYYYLSKVMRLEPKEMASALCFGSAIHMGVGTFYEHKHKEIEKLLDLDPHLDPDQNQFEILLSLVQKAFIKEWNKFGIQGDDKRNLKNGLLIITRYCQFYKDDTQEFLPEFIESEQWISMDNGTMLGFVIDRIAKVSDDIFTYYDSKTSSWSISDYWFKQFDQNFQMSIYAVALEKLLGAIPSFCIDAIKVPYPVRKGTDAFKRKSYLRNDLQLEEALNTYHRVTEYILEGLAIEDEEKRLRHFYQQQTQCDQFGGCKYLPVCMYGLRHPSVKTDFHIKGGEIK